MSYKLIASVLNCVRIPKRGGLRRSRSDISRGRETLRPQNLVVALHILNFHAHPYVDVDIGVDLYSFLVFEAISEDSNTVASRGNSEVRRTACRKDRLLR